MLDARCWMLNAKVHMFAGRDRSRPTTRNLPLQSLNLADFEFNRDVRCRAQMRMKEKAGTRMVIAPGLSSWCARRWRWGNDDFTIDEGGSRSPNAMLNQAPEAHLF